MIGRLAEYDIIVNNDFQIFHKTYLESYIYKTNSFISNYFFRKSKIYSHINYISTPEEKTQKEAITIKLWDRFEISTIQLFGLSEKEIYEKRLENSLDYEEIFTKKDNPHRELSSFFNTYNKIRRIARKENNPLILHSDSHLKNFLYDYDKESCVAIDPGLVLRKDISFEEIDRNLLIITLLSFNGLNVEQKVKENYMKKFVKNVFLKKDKENVLDLLNKRCIFDECLVLKEFAASKIKKRNFNENRLHKIKNLENILLS